MRWNEDRTSLLKVGKGEALPPIDNASEPLNAWKQTREHFARRGWGHGPILSEAVPLTLKLSGPPAALEGAASR